VPVNKRIVILGSRGQLGSDICRLLNEYCYIDVVCVNRTHYNLLHSAGIGSYLKNLLPFDVLVNCAAYHHVAQCENDPATAFAVNAAAVKEMACFCNIHSITLFHISTDYVMDGNTTTPYTEEDGPAPINTYGITKLAGEYMLQANHDKFFIFRVASLYGNNGSAQKGGNFVAKMLSAIHENRVTKVVSDQIMSPTYTEDVARAIIHFLQEQITAYGVYHCAGEGGGSWYELAIEIARQSGASSNVFIPVSLHDFPSSVKRPKYSVLNSRKLGRWFRMPLWSRSLQLYLDSHENRGGRG